MPKKAVAITGTGRKLVAGKLARKNVRRYSSRDSEQEEEEEDDTSSSSDDETSSDEDPSSRQRRRSVNSRKNSLALFSSEEDSDSDSDSGSDSSSSSEEENVDYVQLTKRRRSGNFKKKSQRELTESAEEGEIIEQSDSELDDDLVDAVIEKEEKLNNGMDMSMDIDDLDLDVDFNDTTNDSIIPQHKKSEDIGEVIQHESKKLLNPHLDVQLKVPKIQAEEIDSEEDYELDKDQLIETLMNDNDDSELQIEGDSEDEDDDFDRLAESRRQFTPGSEREYITAEEEEGNEDSDADSDKLMALETKAMVDDFYENRTRKLLRRGSIYRNGVVVDDLELDRLDNFEDMFPKQQASFRRRSSILDQSLLSSDEGEDLEDSLSKFRTKSQRRRSKKINKRAHDIRKMLGPIQDGEYNDAIMSDSDDDTKLVLEILNSSGSADEQDEDDDEDEEDDETDEDINLHTNKSTKRHKGSKHAKEVLSSSSLGFGAPPLGTFTTTRKPFSVIDGVSTRFVQPFESPRKKAAKMARRLSRKESIKPIPLDELLNIEEFEEEDEDNQDPFDDPAHDHESNDKLQEMFGERRIPLTAFRNKGLANQRKYPSVNVEEVMHSTNRARVKKPLKKKKKVTLVEPEQPEVEHHVEKNEPVDDEPDIAHKIGGSLEDLPEMDELDIDLDDGYVIANQSDIDGFAAIASDDDEAEFGDIFHDTPKVPHQRKKMLRRASMAEAQKEGMRATKGGVFDESVMENVEAFLMDVGAGEELSFLLAND